MGKKSTGGARKITAAAFSVPLRIPAEMLDVDEIVQAKGILCFKEDLLTCQAKPLLKQQQSVKKQPANNTKEAPTVKVSFSLPVLFYPNPSQLYLSCFLQNSNTKALKSKMTVLLVSWLGRADPKLLCACTLLGHSDEEKLAEFLIKAHQDHRHAGYVSGWRIFNVIQELKADAYKSISSMSDTFQVLEDFWGKLPDQNRAKIMEDELEHFTKQTKHLLARHGWCSCNNCKHRRMGIGELECELLRAYAEELKMAITRAKEGDNTLRRADTISQKFLYRALALTTTSLLRSRQRPVFDVLGAFSGLRFTDHPIPTFQGDYDDEGVIEYTEDDDYEDDYDGAEDVDDDEDDLDDSPKSFFDYFINGRSKRSRSSNLDLSDDDDILECHEGELALDEAELMGPVAIMSKRKSLCRKLLHVSEDDIVLETEGRAIYEMFLSELFLPRLINSFLEAETRKQQEALLFEEEQAAKALEQKRLKNKGKRKKKPLSSAGEVREDQILNDDSVNEPLQQEMCATTDISSETLPNDSVSMVETPVETTLAVDSKEVECETPVDGKNIDFIDKTNDNREMGIDTELNDLGGEPDDLGDRVRLECLSLKDEDDSSVIVESHIHSTTSRPSDLHDINEIINEGLRELSAFDLLMASDCNDSQQYRQVGECPPGFESISEGDPDNRTSNVDKQSAQFNYLTSSLFGPSLFMMSPQPPPWSTHQHEELTEPPGGPFQ